MVGVELRATWTQKRKANGDIVQNRVTNTCKQLKTGKFMHLSMRSWSVNQNCLSKVWFKTHSVDLRAMDVNSVTSSVKSWLYADQLVKPEEKMYRPSTQYIMWSWKLLLALSEHSWKQHAILSSSQAFSIPCYSDIMCLKTNPSPTLGIHLSTTKTSSTQSEVSTKIQLWMLLQWLRKIGILYC